MTAEMQMVKCYGGPADGFELPLENPPPPSVVFPHLGGRVVYHWEMVKAEFVWEPMTLLEP